MQKWKGFNLVCGVGKKKMAKDKARSFCLINTVIEAN